MNPEKTVQEHVRIKYKKNGQYAGWLCDVTWCDANCGRRRATQANMTGMGKAVCEVFAWRHNRGKYGQTMGGTGQLWAARTECVGSTRDGCVTSRDVMQTVVGVGRHRRIWQVWAMCGRYVRCLRDVIIVVGADKLWTARANYRRHRQSVWAVCEIIMWHHLVRPPRAPPTQPLRIGTQRLENINIFFKLYFLALKRNLKIYFWANFNSKLKYVGIYCTNIFKFFVNTEDFEDIGSNKNDYVKHTIAPTSIKGLCDFSMNLYALCAKKKGTEA